MSENLAVYVSVDVASRIFSRVARDDGREAEMVDIRHVSAAVILIWPAVRRAASPVNVPLSIDR